MSKEQKMADYEARRERLQWIAENIERGPNGQFYGADFQLGFAYVFGELVVLQREFNKRFAADMPGDARFAEFYSRIIQIMESSESVLINSAGPTQALLKEQKSSRKKGSKAKK